MRSSVTFRVIVRDDAAEERTVEAIIECDGAPKRLEPVSLLRSIDGVAPTADVMLEEACAGVERWCESQGIQPVDHRQEFARLLGLADGPVRQPPVTEVLGSPPLQYPRQGSLAGKKHARTDDEVPAVPPSSALSEVGRRGQRVLIQLTDAVGGRLGLPPTKRIPIGHVDLLAEVFIEWVEHYGERQADGISFTGPGLWHALDRLVPLQDPNRWDPLRKAVTAELEQRGWQRLGGVRGSTWWIPDG